MIATADIFARIRNIFNIATLKKRQDKTVTVETDFSRTLEGEEFFPYGFCAKAKKGRTAVLCQGGNAGSYIFLPIASVEGAPDLRDGDVALWTAGGGFIVCRAADKTLELNGTEYGGIIKIEELKNELEKINTFLKKFVETLKTAVTEPGNGAPSALQQALNTALSTLPFADFTQIENEKVKHGKG